jgi:hypothetical protein
MNKIQFITEILNIYEENETLKSKVKDLENARPVAEVPDKMTDFVIKYGKEKLMEKVVRSWDANVKVSKDEETEKTSATSFEYWKDQVVAKDRIPPEISYIDLVDFLDKELHEFYQKELTKAIKEFEDE